MNTKKHSNKLQKSSLLFFQLGLILALFTVYVAVEHKTLVTDYSPPQIAYEDEVTLPFHPYEDYVIEEVKVKQKKVVQQKQPTLEDPIIKDNDTKEVEKLPFEDPVSDSKTSNVDIIKELVDEDDGDDLVDEPRLMMNIQEVPIFPGCEKVKKSERRACFEKKVRKFVSRKFNADVASGITSKRNKIFVEFIISKTGEIKIENLSAPHKRLDKEARRVVNKLPKMVPGKHNGKEVKVKYMLPIIYKNN